MSITYHLDHQTFSTIGSPIDLAIPLDFYGPQPILYGVAAANGQAYQADGFIGDVRRGGGLNFETYQLTPHCNGTHTECVGHLTQERLYVHEVLKESFWLSQLITIESILASQTQDQYDPPLQDADRVIDRSQLIQAWPLKSKSKALIIRTHPNPSEKRYWDYSQVQPPFFTLEAMQEIRARGVQNLLVDFPSVDRLFDEGKLRNHRTFWGLAPGQKALRDKEVPTQTITEMVYVPEGVIDGTYLLELQIAPFLADAAPSRPRIFELRS